MNLKANLTYLSILIGLVLFSNQMGYAQLEPSAIIPTNVDGNTTIDILKLQVENVHQYDLCFGTTAIHPLQKFHAGIMPDKLGFEESVKSYFVDHLERNDVNENNKYLSDMSPLLTGLSYTHFALNRDPGKPVENKEFYLHKSKNQNTAGFILLGGGTVMAIIGAIGFDANFEIWSNDDAKANRADFFGFMLLTGIVADLVSIPFFISSHHNKKIASIISLGNQNIQAPLMNSYSMNSHPALTFKVNF